MSASLDATPDRHRLLLEDHRVTQLTVERAAFRLQTWTLGDAMELRVAVPFVLRQADGDDRGIDPAEPERMAPLLTLIGRRVELLELGRDGALLAGFSDGTVLRAAPHARREAWQVQGAGGLEGLAYRCPPGGGPPWTTAPAD